MCGKAVRSMVEKGSEHYFNTLVLELTRPRGCVKISSPHPCRGIAWDILLCGN